MHVKIKVCRVNDVDTAIRLERLGVDFVGIHMKSNVIYDKEILYKTLARELVKAGLVVVTRTKDIELLGHIINKLEPEYLQLHSRWSKKESEELRKVIQRWGRTTKVIGVVALETSASTDLISDLVDVWDYMLFDSSFGGGTGILIREEILRTAAGIAKSYGTPFFIAGGLNPENVGYYVRTYRPYGVDVQSGVEVKGTSQKDLSKVEKFITECRKSSHNH